MTGRVMPEMSAAGRMQPLKNDQFDQSEWPLAGKADIAVAVF